MEPFIQWAIDHKIDARGKERNGKTCEYICGIVVSSLAEGSKEVVCVKFSLPSG